MDFVKAMQVVGVTADEEAEYVDQSLPAVALALAVIIGRLEGGADLSEDEAAAVRALCERLRVFADRHERDMMRNLKFDQGMKWQEVADAVDGQLGSRQAAQKRWSRLTDGDRRTKTGDYRRGAAELGRRVNDTMSPTVERSDG